MQDMVKRYQKFRRPQKPERCQHCNSRRMVARGEMWGCFDCGRWEGLDGSSSSTSRGPFGGWTADPKGQS